MLGYLFFAKKKNKNSLVKTKQKSKIFDLKSTYVF